MSRPLVAWSAASLVAVALAFAGARWAGSPTNVDADPPATRRLVSLSPPITETLFALGAGDQVVARSTWCSTPVEATRLPTVGSALEPALEDIVALRPTTILTEATMAGRTDQLTAIAPTEVLPWLSVSDLDASVRRLGALTGRVPEANALADRLVHTLGVTPPADAPVALFLLGLDGIERGEVWFVKRNSLHGAALHAAGLRNAIDEDVSGAPSMSIERLIALDPPLVLVVLAEDRTPDEARALVREKLAALPLTAVRAGRVGAIAGPRTYDTGPGILTVAEQLRAEAAAATGTGP